jgi:heme exporter protein A
VSTATNGPESQPAGTDDQAAPAIVLDKLARYFGERTVLRDLSLELPKGQTLAVLGRNGAGKSTLLRILATLLRPHHGTVRVLGHELPRNGWAARGSIGLLGHEPLLYRDLTGRENLIYQGRLHSVPQQRIDEVLRAVAMENRADDPVRSLSRGMVQRLTVARAVLHEPQLLLLDEPKSNLDPAANELVEPLIGRSSGRTRVLTSHDPQSALQEADLVLALQDGKAAYLGPPQGFSDADIKRLYA